MRKQITSLVIAAAAAMAFMSPVQAAQQTFAQFNEIGAPSPQDFVFNQGTGIFGTTSPIQVTFTYLTANSFNAAGTPVTGWLTMTSQTDDSAVVAGGQVIQPMFNTQISINTQANGLGANLLTMGPGSTGVIVGASNGHTGSFTGDSDPSASGDSINFSSDFLTFAPSSVESFALGLTSISPSLTSTQGELQAFSAAGVGSFASDPLPTVPVPTPEASTVVSFGAMLIFGGMMLFARRRAAVHAE